MSLKLSLWRSLKTLATLFALTIFLISAWSWWLAFSASRMIHEEMQRLLGGQRLLMVSFMAAEINRKLDDQMKTPKKVVTRVALGISGSKAVLQNHLEQREDRKGQFNAGVATPGFMTRRFPTSRSRTVGAASIGWLTNLFKDKGVPLAGWVVSPYYQPKKLSLLFTTRRHACC